MTIQGTVNKNMKMLMASSCSILSYVDVCFCQCKFNCLYCHKGNPNV